MPRYKAIAPGTLSNPFRYVTADEVVTMQHPIKSTWLKEVDEMGHFIDEQPKPIPLMPHLKEVAPAAKNVTPPAISDPDYDRSMEAVSKLEKEQDKAAKAKKESASQPSEGTGNKDVI